MPHAVALALAALLVACADAPTSWPVEADATDADPCGPPPAERDGYTRGDMMTRGTQECAEYTSPDGVCEVWWCRVDCEPWERQIERCYDSRASAVSSSASSTSQCRMWPESPSSGV